MTTAPEPGIYRDVPFAEYERWNAWNPSKIKTLLQKSPRALRYDLDHDKGSSAAMDTGKAAHMAILEPDRFMDTYVVFSGARRQGKAWDDFQAANEGKEVVKADEYYELLAMRHAVESDPVSGPIMAASADHEVSIVWIDADTGLLCKGRLDRLEADNTITDLKTTADPYHRAFRNTFTRLLYHVSLAAYTDGLSALDRESPGTQIIAVQSAAPFEVVVYQPSRGTILEGYDQWKRGLKTIAECIRNGVWPGPETKPVPLDLPEWAFSESDVTY
jgi:hypothetical protein